MRKKYYKRPTKAIRKLFKFSAIGVVLVGIGLILYVFFPLLSWQIYFAPVFAKNLDAPIPKTNVLTGANLSNLLRLPQDMNINYMDAQTWFPKYRVEKQGVSQTYSLSIPKLKITNAVVSTNDNYLENHLVHYGGTAIPPSKGTAVIFGHSTLPQLFNEKDYKTIFATLYQLDKGDQIVISVDGITYSYFVYEIQVVDANDNSVFDQNYNDSFLTLVTCTPPGTVWKRLLIKAKIKPV